MLAHLHLSNDRISGMIELDIYLPVRVVGPPKTGMRKLSKPTIFYDPKGLLEQESLPPWKGWWRSSGNKVYGETRHSMEELHIDWSDGGRCYIEISKKTRLWVGRRLVINELPKLYERRFQKEGRTPLEQVGLEVVKLVVL